MSEITVENLDAHSDPPDVVSVEGAPKTLSERLVERGDGDFVEPAESVPEREPAALHTSGAFHAAQCRRGGSARTRSARQTFVRRSV